MTNNRKSIDDLTPEEWDRARAYEGLEELSRIDQENFEYSNVSDVYKMFPEAFEMLQIVIDFGGQKHGYGSYLDKDNISMQPKADYASRNRHAAKDFCGERFDEDTKVLHLAHEAARCLMRITRIVRGIEDADQ